MSDSLRPHRLQHARLPCLSPCLEACSNSCPSSRWCHPTISSSVIPFSFCLQSFPASESFLMSQSFTSGGQSIGASLWLTFCNMIFVLAAVRLCFFCLPSDGWGEEACVSFLMGGTGMGKTGSCFGGQGLAQWSSNLFIFWWLGLHSLPGSCLARGNPALGSTGSMVGLMATSKRANA